MFEQLSMNSNLGNKIVAAQQNNYCLYNTKLQYRANVS